MSGNKVQLGHLALHQLLLQAFPLATVEHNPGGHSAPKAAGADGLSPYVAQTDDAEPEVLAVMMGPVYDLKVTPEVVLAFSGRTKAVRSAAAWVAVETLRQVLAADVSLGGSVDYADIESITPIQASDSEWLAGGIAVRVRLLVTAPSAAG